jgi:hypothetical protein
MILDKDKLLDVYLEMAPWVFYFLIISIPYLSNFITDPAERRKFQPFYIDILLLFAVMEINSRVDIKKIKHILRDIIISSVVSIFFLLIFFINLISGKTISSELLMFIFMFSVASFLLIKIYKTKKTIRSIDYLIPVLINILAWILSLKFPLYSSHISSILKSIAYIFIMFKF